MELINANSNQPISPSDLLGRELRTAFERNPAATFNQGELEELYRANKGYMRECVRVMFSLALKKVQLQIIDLPNERLSEDGALVLRVLMQVFVRLSYIRLLDNALGTNGLRHLIAGFHYATQIEVLDLGMNHLNDESAAVLADGLSFTPHLQTLRVNNNEISDAGATRLASALLPLRLIFIDLSFNDIASAGCASLAQQFPNSLMKISLVANKIGGGAVPSLKMCLRRLLVLREFNLGGNLFKSSERKQLKTGRHFSVVHFGVNKSSCSLM